MTEVRYRNHYCCAERHAPELWANVSDSQNNRRCPICDTETEPYRFELLEHRACAPMSAVLMLQAQMTSAAKMRLPRSTRRA